MNDTPNLPSKAPMRAGGQVAAFVPRDLDEIWRMARMAYMGQMAPKSLTDGKDPDEATSACAIAIMAGAELGLTPLMALRSYAVVNGRPVLWGDGIIAVVRNSGRAEYIRSGFTDELGWCEAKRKDTGESKRVEFTLQQARDAKLTDKKGPWMEHRGVMMERRAKFRCLNDLFADVLGGIANGEEAIDDGPMPGGDMRDITPQRSAPMMFPDIPDEEEGEGDATESETEGDPSTEGLEGFLTAIDDAMATATDEESGVEVWDSFDVEATLTGDEDALERAFTIRNRHLKRLEQDPLEDPDVPQESKDAVKNMGAG